MAYKPTRGYDPLEEPVMIPVSEVGLIAEAHGAPVWGAAAAGIGGYGESGLLVTEAFGPAVRLGGIVTDAEIAPPADTVHRL